MVRDELEEKCFGRWPGAGGLGREPRPGFQVAKIRGKRAKCVFAHALNGEMLERRDIFVGQQRSQLIAGRTVGLPLARRLSGALEQLVFGIWHFAGQVFPQE